MSEDNRRLARHIAAVFGGRPAVREFLHDVRPLNVDILSCVDVPGPGFTSYSTVGLSDHEMMDGPNVFPAGVEFASVMESAAEGFHRVIGSAAFRVMQTREVVRPGRVFEGFVREYFPGSHLPHLYFTAPFHWGERLNSVAAGAKRVAWLLGLPISDSEWGYLKAHGDEAFEDLLQEHDADTSMLTRPSVV